MAVQIRPGLWMGGALAVKDLDTLGIDYVVNCCKGLFYTFELPTFYIPWKDCNEDLNPDVFFAAASIGDNLAHKRNVLVHCNDGKNRSVALVAVYLMMSENTTCKEALDAIREKNPDSAPEPGFIRQLDKMYAYIHNTPLSPRSAGPSVKTPPQTRKKK